MQTSSTELEATAAKVADLVRELQNKKPSPRILARSESLSDAGITSLEMVNLMLAIEAAFDIFIPAEMITPGSFRSIASIAEMIDSLARDAARS
jgi:acyl carrier protein